MTEMEKDALTLVNRIRRYEGRNTLKRLPKGDVGNVYSCPLARALNHGHVSVGDTLDVAKRHKKKVAAFKKARLVMYEDDPEYPDDDVAYFKMPDSFNRFIAWFDNQATDEAQHLARKPTRR